MASLIILSTEPKNWVPTELSKIAEKEDFTVEIINPDECYISLTGEPYISFNGTKFLGADVCIPRLSEEHLDYKVAIIDHIEKMGVKVLNTGDSLRTASNKIDTQIKLNAAGIKTPATALFTNEEQLEFAITSIGGKFPMIVKTIFGTHGVGVIRADSRESLTSIVQQMLKSNTSFMLQEYIEHKESARILLLDGEVIGAVMRDIPKNDFRTNAHQGAELKKYEPSEKEVEIIKKSAETIGITFAAVDYIIKDKEVILLEINGSPGFEAMQKVVDGDIAQQVIEYCKKIPIDKEEKSEDTEELKDIDEEDVKADDEVKDDEEVKEAKDESKDESKDEDLTFSDFKDLSLDKDAPVDDYKEDKSDDKEPEDKSEDKSEDKETDDVLYHDHDNVIGTVTSVIISHFNDGNPIEARVDTGANTSSISGEDIVVDGNTVKFKFNDTHYKFHLLKKIRVKQADNGESKVRPVIRVDIEINGMKLRNIEMNVNERGSMNFSVLLGRSTLAQAGVLVNPAAANIDRESAYIENNEEE